MSLQRSQACRLYVQRADAPRSHQAERACNVRESSLPIAEPRQIDPRGILTPRLLAILLSPNVAGATHAALATAKVH